MKIVFACVTVLFLLSCNNDKTEAEKKAAEITNAMEQSKNKTSQTDAGGFYLKANIDGNEWVAEKTIPEGNSGSNFKLVNGETDEYSINFQIYKPKAGDKREFREDYASNLVTKDGYFSGYKGEVTVTKVDENWIEGEFHFTATSQQSSKKYEVTNGFFRIPNN